MVQRTIVRAISGDNAVSWWLCAIVALAFATLIIAGGSPALRHDWLLFRDRGDFFTSAWNTFGGWIGNGIGAPRPYPTDYILIAANSALVALLGAHLDIAAILFFIGLGCARTGWLIAARLDPHRSTRVAAAVFFTFNPWVYSKIVAGHVFMVLACAAVALLVLELSRTDPDERYAALIFMLALVQLQFFIVAFALVFAWSILRRRIFVLLAGFVAALPIIIGIIANESTLLATPYNLAWQADQSVDPVQALLLQGYFTHYTQGFPAFTTYALWGICLLALAGAILSIGTNAGRLGIAFAAIVWIGVSGTKGFASPVYIYLVTHVAQSGVFRELYDLIGYLVICYVFFAAAAVAKFPWLRVPWLAVSCMVALAWIFDPPYQFWVALQQIPPARVSADANSRFALIPAFQPLQFHALGSGLDPDAFARFANVMPLNTAQLDYPSDAALSQYIRWGDDRMLSALSVSEIVARPWLSEDRKSLQWQTTLISKSAGSAHSASRRIPHFRHELTIETFPRVSDFVADPNADQVWFSDVAGMADPGLPAAWRTFERATPIVASNAALNPRKAWVDARPAFAFEPELAQAVGGVWTMSRTAVLDISAGRQALVFIRGTLISQEGRLLAATTHGYRWIPIPLSVHGILCRGTCVVSALGNPPPAPADGHERTLAELTFTSLAPWLEFAELAPGKSGALRYNVRFDPHWIAISGGKVLPHFKIAMLFNGWALPERSGPAPVILLENVALVQFIFELCGVLLAAYLLGSRLHRPA